MVTKDIAQVEALKPKIKLKGTIIKTTLAGALVDIGRDLPGVVHISQIKAEPVNKVEDVVRIGQTVDVWIRRIKKDRIELTMIEPLAFEWREILPGAVVNGKVVRLEPYGAFVDFGAEKPGLIHVSELTHGYVKTPDEIIKVGDEVQAKVLDVDRRKRQIRLSMKALLPEPTVEEKPHREDRKTRRPSKIRKPKIVPDQQPEAQSEPQLTAMQFAWQEAVDRTKGHEKGQRVKTQKAVSLEQEDILNRTLEKRLPTG